MSKTDKKHRSSESKRTTKEKSDQNEANIDRPVSDSTVDVTETTTVAGKKEKKKKKKDKKSKKRDKKEEREEKKSEEKRKRDLNKTTLKGGQNDEAVESEHVDNRSGSAPELSEGGSEAKCEKTKKKRKYHETEDDLAAKQPAQTSSEKKRSKKPKTSTPTVLADAQDQSDHGEGKSGTRFIVFIGNLPYTATKESIATHFSKLPPVSIRAPMTNDNKKSKGFAFLEFDRFDYMKSCLKLYHHSNFDDGKSPARKINVELTVGGGGSKSDARKEKLKAKNDRLNEQRKRRAEHEAKEKARAEKKSKMGPGRGANAQPVTHTDSPSADSAGHHDEGGDNSGIHPARLAMMRR